MRAIINLWTYKNFCAAAIFRASGEVAKVRLEKEADQEVIGPEHRILPFLGGQGELLKEFQKKCDSFRSEEKSVWWLLENGWKGGRVWKKEDCLEYCSNGWQQVKDAQTKTGVAEANGEGSATGIVWSQAGLLLEPLLMPSSLLWMLYSTHSSVQVTSPEHRKPRQLFPPGSWSTLYLPFFSTTTTL